MIKNIADRPTSQLRRVVKRFTRISLSEYVNAMYEYQRPQAQIEEWPKWCFMPRTMWTAIYTNETGDDKFFTLEAKSLLTELVTLVRSQKWTTTPNLHPPMAGAMYYWGKGGVGGGANKRSIVLILTFGIPNLPDGVWQIPDAI